MSCKRWLSKKKKSNENKDGKNDSQEDKMALCQFHSKEESNINGKLSYRLPYVTYGTYFRLYYAKTGGNVAHSRHEAHYILLYRKIYLK